MRGLQAPDALCFDSHRQKTHRCVQEGHCRWLHPDGETQVIIEDAQNAEGSMEPLRFRTLMIVTQQAAPGTLCVRGSCWLHRRRDDCTRQGGDKQALRVDGGGMMALPTKQLPRSATTRSGMACGATMVQGSGVRMAKRGRHSLRRQ